MCDLAHALPRACGAIPPVRFAYVGDVDGLPVTVEPIPGIRSPILELPVAPILVQTGQVRPPGAVVDHQEPRGTFAGVLSGQSHQVGAIPHRGQF